MFKRAIWMGTGYGLGVGTSWWVKRKVAREVEKKVEQYVPAPVRDKAETAAKVVNQRVAQASEAMAPHMQSVQQQMAPRVAQGREALRRAREAREARSVT